LLQINGFLWDVSVNDDFDPNVGSAHATGRVPRRSPLLLSLVVLLFVECAIVVWAAGYLLVELVTETPVSYASAIAILVLTILAAVWVAMIAFHTLAGRAWTRGATVVWQVLQAAIGLGALQGLFARPDIGWPLIVLAVVVLVLLFTKPVLSATQRTEE
jgi:hypothetical protein